MDATPRRVVCHANTPGILPVQWCLKNGVSLERPRGFEGQDFDWADYLKQSATEAAPESCFPDVSSNRSDVERQLGRNTPETTPHTHAQVLNSVPSGASPDGNGGRRGNQALCAAPPLLLCCDACSNVMLRFSPQGPNMISLRPHG